MHGVVTSINIITTFETLDNPLTTKDVEKIVADYFLQERSNAFTYGLFWLRMKMIERISLIQDY